MLVLSVSFLVAVNFFIIIIDTILSVFHTNVSWWLSIGVRETAHLSIQVDFDTAKFG